MRESDINLPREVRKYGERGPKSWEDSGGDKEIEFYGMQKQLAKAGLEFSKGMKVLELGSGDAKLLSELKKQGLDAVGVDVRPRGRSNESQVIARIEELPFPDETFDVIHSSQIFDNGLYEQDQNMMITEIVRVLKHGGVYLASVEALQAGIPEDLEIIEDDYLRGVYRKK